MNYPFNEEVEDYMDLGLFNDGIIKVGDEYEAAGAGAVVTEKAAPAATTDSPPPK